MSDGEGDKFSPLRHSFIMLIVIVVDTRATKNT